MWGSLILRSHARDARGAPSRASARRTPTRHQRRRQVWRLVQTGAEHPDRCQTVTSVWQERRPTGSLLLGSLAMAHAPEDRMRVIRRGATSRRATHSNGERMRREHRPDWALGFVGATRASRPIACLRICGPRRLETPGLTLRISDAADGLLCSSEEMQALILPHRTCVVSSGRGSAPRSAASMTTPLHGLHAERILSHDHPTGSWPRRTSRIAWLGPVRWPRRAGPSKATPAVRCGQRLPGDLGYGRCTRREGRCRVMARLLRRADVRAPMRPTR